MLPFEFKSWQDVGSFVTIVCSPLIVVSVIAAFVQIRTQTANTHKQASSAAFLNFSERFQQISLLRRSLKVRAEQGDRTLGREDVMAYFTQYWLLRLEEWQFWDFFGSSLLPFDAYLGYQLNTYAHMAGEKNLDYFDDKGERVTVSSRHVFETHVLGSMYKHHRECLAFFRGLYELGGGDGEPRILPEDDRYNAIKQYVRRGLGADARQPRGAGRP